MCIPSAHPNLNLTPQGLFPNHLNPNKDAKCVIVASVIEQLVNNAKSGRFSQQELQGQAQARYDYLSVPDKLPLHVVDEAAYQLFCNGVDASTAARFHSFRLSPYDAKVWKGVVIIKTDDDGCLIS